MAKKKNSIKQRLSAAIPPEWHLVFCDINEIDPEAIKKYKRNNKTEKEDKYIIINLLNGKMVDKRKGEN